MAATGYQTLADWKRQATGGHIGASPEIQASRGNTLLQGALAKAGHNLSREQWEWQKKQHEEAQAGMAGASQGLGRLVGRFNRATGRARQANVGRYRRMLNIAGRTTDQRARDIRQGGRESLATQKQQLARQGMGGTTVGHTLGEGVRRGTESNLNRLADQMQGTRLGIMERRTDEYPDSGMITTLAQMLGRAGGPSTIPGQPGVGGGAQGLGGLAQAMSKMRF